MINLLPPEHRQEIIYGRKNKALVGWIIAMLIVLIGVIAITFIGQFYIKSNVNNLNKTIQATQQRIKDQNLEARQAEISQFANNLNTVNSLLADQLLFSKIITNLGEILPSGVTVQNIDFTSTDSTLKLQLIGADEKAVTQGFVNVSSAPNSLITAADLESVDCSGQGGCVATVTALLNKDSELYFLNDIKSRLDSQ
jgi:Tfp pilus assembly protein PilN